jgi:hypothetical protein
MKTKILLIIAVVVLLVVDKVQAVDVDFYSDATIEDGDVYTNVFVYDTPPDTTTLDMYGGSVAGFGTYNSSIVNIYGGEVWWGLTTLNLSTVNIYGGIINFESLFVVDSSTLNIYGGYLLVGNSPGFSDLSTVNIYGYGFERGINNLTGFLSDGSSFTFNELFSDEYSHMNLIVVPEPISAEIDIKPTTLNLASKGKWVTCYIRLPDDSNVAEIDPETILLEQRVKANWAWFNEQQQVAMVKFSRSELVGILEPGEVELTVSGQLSDGARFEGMDTIKVIDKGKKK